MRYLSASLVVAAGLALAACGGDGGDGDTARAPQAFPQPSGSLDQAARQMKRAIASGDCRQLFAVAQHSTKRAASLSEHNAPPTKAECAYLRGYAKGLKGYTPGPSRQFGSAGLVDVAVPRQPITTSTFVLDIDGRWKQVVATGSNRQVGTRPAADSKADENVARFVDAARAGDCDEAFRLLSAASFALAGRSQTRAGFCKTLEETAHQRRSFFVRVKKDPDAKPVALGKTQQFAFYGLAVDPGLYYTLVVFRQPSPNQVTSEHERDGVFNWYLGKE